MCSEHDGRQSWFQVLGAAGVYCKGPQEEAGSWVQEQAEGHTHGSKKATVQAGKRLVTSSRRSGIKLITGNPIG